MDTLRRAVEAAQPARRPRAGGRHRLPAAHARRAVRRSCSSSTCFACTLRRVPLAGLPLLAAFTAPVSLLGGVSWLTFALAAVSFVLLLAADQASRLGQWGRSLSGPAPPRRRSRTTVGLATLWPTATRIGVAGVGLAVLAPVCCPRGRAARPAIGPGTATAMATVTIENPMLNVRRDLSSRADVPLLAVRTDDPDAGVPPAHRARRVRRRRLAPLRARHPRRRTEADGPLPAPPGLDPVDAATRSTSTPST